MLQARVIDLPLRGSSFTWSNNREVASWARLDRFLISPQILSWFPNLLQSVLPRSVSDHNAITLGVPKVDWGPVPFRFYSNWLEDRDLMKQAMNGWNGCSVKGSNGRILAAKLRASKTSIKNCLPARKNDSFDIKIFEDRLSDLDRKAVSVGWSDDLRKERLAVVEEMWKGV